MQKQLSLNEFLFEEGVMKMCHRYIRVKCNHEACTLAQGVTCCDKCPTRCSNPCPRSRKR